MSNTLRRVNVFIASPGDVSEARDRARKAIERINRLVAKPSGFLFEPIGWEDIPACKGERTQDVINPYVDAADIFVGILNKRFGRHTGVAESGTEEEYNRIEKRWYEENPKPEIIIYFKKLSKEDIADPGEQLQRVIQFKKRILDTVLYKEFKGSDDLAKKIEDALADWTHRQRGSAAAVLRERDVDALESTDIEILAYLVQHADVSAESLQAPTGYTGAHIDSSIARLERHGLVAEYRGKIKPSNSTDGFLSIVKHLIDANHWRLLLQCEYYNDMLRSTLRDLIASRFHCKVEVETADVLYKMALLSPAAASYLLFGETALYDNLAEHARTLGEAQVAIANKMAERDIVHRVLLHYSDDSIYANLLDTLEGRSIAGQLITVRVAAAYEDGRAFDVHSVVPMMRFRASGDIEKGQMVSGAPSLFIQTGTTFMHIGEFDLAVKEFDKASSPETPPDVRAAAMNNKGLILLERGQVSEAIEIFRKSVKLDPKLPEPRKNLEIAESMLGSNGQMPDRI